MANITFRGTPANTVGNLPAVGAAAPAFTLTAADLSDKTLADFAGKRKVLNIFPSIDTGVCAQSVRTFNQRAAALQNAVVLCVSADLPFALSRFCGAEGIENVVTLSPRCAASPPVLWWCWMKTTKCCMPNSFPKSAKSPTTMPPWPCCNPAQAKAKPPAYTQCRRFGLGRYRRLPENPCGANAFR